MKYIKSVTVTNTVPHIIYANMYLWLEMQLTDSQSVLFSNIRMLSETESQCSFCNALNFTGMGMLLWNLTTQPNSTWPSVFEYAYTGVCRTVGIAVYSLVS